MDTSNGSESFSPRVILILSALFLVLLFCLPRTGKFNYDYKKGSPWSYETLVAQFDFPLLKTEEQLQSERDAAGNSVIPYYKFNDETAQNAIRSAEGIRLPDDLRSRVISLLGTIYGRGVLPDSEPSRGGEVIFVQKGKRANRVPYSEVYTVSSARSFLRDEFIRLYRGDNPDSVLTASLALDVIVPNLYFDKDATDLVHAQNAENISTTSGFIPAGQTIVSRGEIVTAEIKQMLDSYREEFEDTLGYPGPRFKLWLGNILLSLSLTLLLFFAIYFAGKEVFKESNRFLYLVLVFLMASLIALIVDKVSPVALYMVPFSLTAMFLLAFFRRSLVLPVYMISLLPVLIFTHGGMELFVMYLVGGSVTMYAYPHINRGWRQFVGALFLFLALLMVFLGFRFITGVKGLAEMDRVAYLFIGSVLTVLGYPLIFLFEKMFSLVSSNRLRELSETSNPVLLDLASKAPGTFQHTLQVATISEACARKIGADVGLVRAGAMYHDIGKMENPFCFTENQVSDMEKSYHSSLTYEQSARDIIRHVQDGVAIAKKNKLPDVIAAFITAHHGTTHTGYYYNKFLNEGGDPAEADRLFSYPGPAPTTKEQIIVMVCDSVEAASRSLKDYSPQVVSALVEGIFATKMKEGQFDNADISFKEINILKSTLKEHIEKSNHRRIAYPKLAKAPDGQGEK